MLLTDGDLLTYSFPFSVEKGGELVQGAERILEARLDDFINYMLDDSGTDDYKIFLTSKREDKLEENHRYKYLPDYKDGRTAKKPVLHEYTREYLKAQHLAVMSIEGLEADDMIAMEHMQLWDRERSPSIIASIDKDFDQLPGWHYRWEMKRSGKTTPSDLYFIEPLEGARNLYMQALTGDKVDNIGYKVVDGKQTKEYYLRGIGKKKAEKILAECSTEKEMYNAALAVYISNIAKVGGLHDHIEQEAEDLLINNMHGLYLVRGFRGKAMKIWRKP